VKRHTADGPTDAVLLVGSSVLCCSAIVLPLYCFRLVVLLLYCLGLVVLLLYCLGLVVLLLHCLRLVGVLCCLQLSNQVSH
jgi:hypothetical protein